MSRCNNDLVVILSWKKNHHHSPGCTWPLNPDEGFQEARDFIHAVAWHNHECVARILVALKVLLTTESQEWRLHILIFLALLSFVSVNTTDSSPQNIKENIPEISHLCGLNCISFLESRVESNFSYSIPCRA